VAVWITDTDLNAYCDTDKTCLGRGMHCPSASSYVSYYGVLPQVDRVMVLKLFLTEKQHGLEDGLFCM